MGAYFAIVINPKFPLLHLTSDILSFYLVLLVPDLTHKSIVTSNLNFHSHSRLGWFLFASLVCC